MKQNFKRKLLAGVLSVCMIFQTAGMAPVYAVENGADSGTSAGTSTVCENHTEHDEECGYVEGTKGSPCTHEHTEDCYVEVEKCIHEHTDECYPDTDDEEATGSEAKELTECTHMCDEESGCFTMQLDCQHEHDEECGYVEAGKGSPCTHTCELCAKDGEEDVEEIIKEDTELATDSNAQAVSEENIKEVQALIDALPTLEALKEITDKEEQKAIYDDLQTAYEAYKALTKEEQAEVTGAEVFESLFDWFNNQVAIATDVVTYPSWEAATAEGVTLNEGDKITIGGVDYTYKGDGSSTGIALVEGDLVGYNPLTGDLVWKADSGYVLYSYHGTKENPGEASVTLHGAVIAAGTDTALDLPWYGNGRDNTGISTTVQLEDENMLTGYIALCHSSGSTTITGNGSGTLELNSTNRALDLADFEISGGAEVTIQSGTYSEFIGSLTVGAGSKLTIGKDAALATGMDATSLKTETGGTLENSGTLALWMASGLTIENSGTLANNGTIQLPLGTTTDNIKGMKFSGSGTVQVHNDEQRETFDTYLKVGENYYLSGGDKSKGLDLSKETPTKTTVYQAGSGTALWEPVMEGGTLKSATLTLTDATINASSSDSATAVSLPDIPVDVVLKGTNSISASATNSATGFNCSPTTTFNLTEGSKTTVTAGGYQAFVLRKDSGNITIKGSGALTFAGDGAEHFGIRAKYGTVNLEGGTLSIQTAGYDTSVDIYGSVNLGAITIPAGETLDLTSNPSYPTTVSSFEGGTVVDGTLVLGAKPEDFTKFTGTGTIQVLKTAADDDTPATYDTYKTDGTKLIISTTALDFSKTAAEGGWSATATVEDNGYHWEGDAANGYTLTLGNLNLTAGNPIILPDADVGIVLKGKTTLNAEQPGIYSTGTASGHTVTISGDGSLSTTSENNKGINIVQNLSITGGTLDMKGRAGGIYSNGDIEISGGTITGNTIESYDGALTISGGTVDVSGTNNSGITAYTNITISGGTVNADSTNNVGIHAIEAVKISGGSVTAKGGLTAILGRTGITLTGMRITNPAGAAVGDSVKDPGGKAILLNGADALNVTIGKTPVTPPDNGGSSNSDSGSSSGGSSSSSAGSNSNSTDTSTTGKAEVKVDVDQNGNAAVSITDKAVADAIKQAQDAAKKNGTEKNGISVVINVTTNKDASTISATLPKSVQEQLTTAGVKEFKIVSKNVEISLNQNAIKQVKATANADVTITATKADGSKLSAEAQTALGGRPVYDFKATYVTTVNGIQQVNTISNFGNGSVSIAIPYTLGANEKAGNLYAIYIDSKGKVTYITHSSYDVKTGRMIFSTNHFSYYGIGYKADTKETNFADIAGHWAKNDIEFVAARGLLAGTAANTFSPNLSMTRGMFVTALGRLAGADVSGYTSSSFTDVAADTYYMGYVEWANSKGIVKGTSATTFAPDQAVTREEMAVMMANYAKAMGYAMPKTNAEITFSDNASISTWAKDSAKSMQMAGIIMGKDNNRFDPKGTATRAEVSAVLHRFVELVIDTATTQGWTKNDSGHWLYYKDGKVLIGWAEIDKKWYCFDKDGVMLAGKWIEIDKKWYYLQADGTMATNTTIDGYEVDGKGVRKEK